MYVMQFQILTKINWDSCKIEIPKYEGKNVYQYFGAFLKKYRSGFTKTTKSFTFARFIVGYTYFVSHFQDSPRTINYMKTNKYFVLFFSACVHLISYTIFILFLQV